MLLQLGHSDVFLVEYLYAGGFIISKENAPHDLIQNIKYACPIVSDGSLEDVKLPHKFFLFTFL